MRIKTKIPGTSQEMGGPLTAHSGGPTGSHAAGRRLTCRCILAGLLLSLSGASCSRQEPEPLRVGSVIWPGYEPFYVARQMGWLDAKQVHLMEYTATSEIMRAFGNGALDAGMMTLDEALLLAQDVPDIRLVLATDVSSGADVIMAKPEITSLKELKGHRVGAETSALGAYVLMRALQLSDMTPRDVEIVPLDPTEHVAAFTQGHVDAVVTYEPDRTKLRNAGARQIFDSTQIPGEIVDVVVVRDSYLQAHPDTVKHLVQAFYRGRTYFIDKPQEAAQIASLRAKISPAEFLSSLAGLSLPDPGQSRRMLTGKPPPLLKNAQNLAAIMREKGLLSRAVDATALFDERALTRVLP